MMGPLMTMARASDNQTLVVARGNELFVLRQGQAALLAFDFPTVQGRGGRAPFVPARWRSRREATGSTDALPDPNRRFRPGP